MNFVQVEFLWFMTVVFLAYWGLSLLPARGSLHPRRLQGVLIIAASCLFYGWIHAWFLILLFISAINDYLAAIGMERHPRYKPYILLWSFASTSGCSGTSSTSTSSSTTWPG